MVYKYRQIQDVYPYLPKRKEKKLPLNERTSCEFEFSITIKRFYNKEAFNVCIKRFKKRIKLIKIDNTDISNIDSITYTLKSNNLDKAQKILSEVFRLNILLKKCSGGSITDFRVYFIENFTRLFKHTKHSIFNFNIKQGLNIFTADSTAKDHNKLIHKINHVIERFQLNDRLEYFKELDSSYNFDIDVIDDIVGLYDEIKKLHEKKPNINRYKIHLSLNNKIKMSAQAYDIYTKSINVNISENIKSINSLIDEMHHKTYHLSESEHDKKKKLLKRKLEAGCNNIKKSRKIQRDRANKFAESFRNELKPLIEQKLTNQQIADILNRKGFKSFRGLPLTNPMISDIRRRLGLR